MNCNVDDCGHEAEFRYVWAWGEEGECCATHRAHLENKSTQLGRAITFTAADATRKEYKAPTVRQLSPEVGALRMENADLLQQLKSANARIGELELKVYELESQLDDLRVHAPGPTLSVVEGAPPPTEVERTATTPVEGGKGKKKP